MLVFACIASSLCLAFVILLIAFKGRVCIYRFDRDRDAS
jgi:hypothetical protein